MDFTLSSTSQSVARTLMIFNLFARERRALNAAEIAPAIGAPRSSCAALLKTLVDLSMLSIDRRTSTYFPTTRFAELGRWIVDDTLFPERLTTLLHDLQLITDETITLGAVQDLSIELIRIERSRQAISFTAKEGQLFSLWGTSLGTAYLATRDNHQIRALYRRAEDRKLVDCDKYPLEMIIKTVEGARAQGYAVLENAVFPDASAIAVATDMTIVQRPLVIAIAGPTARLMDKMDSFGRLLVHKISYLKATAQD